MRTSLLVWILTFIALGMPLNAWTQESTRNVVITIATVKASDWQREMTQAANPVGLRGRLQARTLVELTGELKGEEELVLRDGKTRDVVTRWDFAQASEEVIAKETKQEFIGTEVKVLHVTPTSAFPEGRLSITLTHDLQQPQMQSMSYATAATGAEREKHSVTTPRFERLRWQGEVPAGQGERLLTSFLMPQDAATRVVVFLQDSSSQPSAPLEIRQTIYRVPEMDMIEWLLDGSSSDATVIKRLQAAVAEGKASVVSSLTSAAIANELTRAQSGTECWLPEETNADYDLLYQLPCSFAKVLAGTRLEFRSFANQAAWHSTFTPRAPLAVKWPTSWLRVLDKNYQPTGKAIHGWMDWFDQFTHEITTEVVFRDATPQLVAAMSPADQVWGAERQGRWLDVTVAQQLPDKVFPQRPPEDSHAPVDPFVPTPAEFATPPQSSLMMLGIALDTAAARTLLAKRQPEHDEELLRELVARAKQGQAHVVTCALAANQLSRTSRSTQISARMHAYPTEMPSIPSAWEQREVGTSFEHEDMSVAFTQDLAPPERTEWKLARDTPEAIMWQPRFRKLHLTSGSVGLVSPGTHLCAVADIPAIMAGGDLPEHETVFLFAHRPATGSKPEIDASDVEVETLIFQIPVTDADNWQSVTTDDFDSFTQQRLDEGTAQLQSRALLRLRSGTRAILSVVEEYMTATEFDPPQPDAPFRMRPTALEMLPVGLRLEVEATGKPDGTVNLAITLQHSIAKPVEPGLEETLKLAAIDEGTYPGAKHDFDEWRGAMDIRPGKFYRLLSPVPRGDVVTTRVTFVRVRPAH